MGSLGWRPDESIGSLVYRLAQREGVSVVDYATCSLNLSYSRARADLDRLATYQSTRDLSHQSGLPDAELRAHELDLRWARPTWDPRSRGHSAPIQVCPDCLSHAHYGRKIWRTYFAPVCAVHGIELVDRCPYCGAPLPYFCRVFDFQSTHWLEWWPNCPRCTREIRRQGRADSLLTSMSRRWAYALTGGAQFGFEADEFLTLSKRLILSFSTLEAYRQTAEKIESPSKAFTSHYAAAILLHSLLGGNITEAVFQAAIGMPFKPDQLAKDITAWI